MAVAQLRAARLPSAVPHPYRTPPDPAGLRPSPATVALVESQVQALLSATPAFHALQASDREALTRNMVKVAAYAAELVRDDWMQSERLRQHPLVRTRQTLEGPLVRAQESFNPAATAQVGRVTQETLKAIAFPTFVADLIKGTFEAITNSSLKQMEAYMRLLENVGKTVDQFMGENITDDQARDWLSQRYPDHIQVSNRKAVPRPGAEERPPPDFQADLNVSSGDLNEDSIESDLVPAARRRMAQQRLQMLSTMVLMGFNRIVVTGGKIRATMLFHIDASDRLRQEHATDMDFRAAASGSYGFGPWSVSASVSFAYVTSERSTSTSDLNVSADLTGEVEIHFKSDYMPLERFAARSTIAQIQANTAVPEANTPNLGESQAFGPNVQPAPPRTQEPLTSSMTPVGSPLPPPRMPTAPTPPTVVRHVDAPAEQPAATQPAPEHTTAPPASTTPASTTPATTTPATTTPVTTTPGKTTPAPTQPAANHAPAAAQHPPAAGQPAEPQPAPSETPSESQPTPAGAP